MEDDVLQFRYGCLCDH